ncbi:hypothetical protein ACFQ6N_27300 [Kitasatospora sp. NPDC056446]|uniref:hypothetical protein n=1 Tax=Kitasatospora sp. NPDC056446 TaxID=3345819 RepID=UPI0036836A74
MPSKPRRRTGGFAEVLSALPPGPDTDGRSGAAAGPREFPVSAGGFLDAGGRYWRLARGPLERRLAKRLAARADEMTLGPWGRWHEDYPDWFVPVLLTPEERPAAWSAALDEDFLAYEFRAGDGRTLLYLDISC